MGAEKKLRLHFGDYLVKAEVFIYSVLAVLLFITALATVANAGKILWDGLGHWAIAAETLLVLDELLVVLMIVEILHTVRLSLRSHILVAEPDFGRGCALYRAGQSRATPGTRVSSLQQKIRVSSRGECEKRIVLTRIFVLYLSSAGTREY